MQKVLYKDQWECCFRLKYIIKFQSESLVFANKEKLIVILFTTSLILHQAIQAQLPVLSLNSRDL